MTYARLWGRLIAATRLGALTVPRAVMHKLWIDLDGTPIPVADDLSHEEWANQHGHELEALLDAGWMRIQAVIPPYLYLDFRRRLTAAQAKAVAVLFGNRFDQIVVEFAGVARSFTDGEAAMAWMLGKSSTDQRAENG